MSDVKKLLVASYIIDVDTGFVGKIESISTSNVGDSIALRGNGVVRAAFVTDNGDNIKKSLHVSNSQRYCKGTEYYSRIFDGWR